MENRMKLLRSTHPSTIGVMELITPMQKQVSL
jgi:hypothetical protein